VRRQWQDEEVGLFQGYLTKKKMEKKDWNEKPEGTDYKTIFTADQERLNYSRSPTILDTPTTCLSM